MVQNLDLSLARRLSIYISEEQPDLLQDISEKIIDKLILRLDLSQRDYAGIKAVWTFITMYCIITRDLWLFKRSYRNLKQAEVIFKDAINLLNDKVLNKNLLEQYQAFYNTNELLLNDDNLVMSCTVVESWLLMEHYYNSVDSIAVKYIIDLKDGKK
jgi:hypothetical protein